MRRISNSFGRPARMVALRGATAIMLSLAVLPTSFAVAQTYGFSTVAIEGNARIEDDTILSYLGFGRGESVTAGELNAAGQRLRETGLFESVDITPSGNRLIITVVEFPTVNRINFEGNSRLDDADLAALVSSQERRIFNPTAVERDVEVIAQAYAEKGLINASVTPKIIRRSDNRVDLAFEIIETGVTEIEQIAFTGNSAFSDRRLRNVLETKQAGLLRVLVGRDTFSQERIDLDRRVLTDFYLSRGYVDFEVQSVDVSLTRERDGYLVTFNIEEGQPFTIASLNVETDLPDIDIEAYQNAITTRPGATYSPVTLERDIERLEQLAQDQGLRFVRVDPDVSRNDRDLSLDVTYKLVRGERVFIERIDIEGNSTTLDRVVRQQFRVVEGDPFNPREIRQAAERIRSLSYFAASNVNARQGSSEDQVIIDVDVVEAPTGSLSFGGNYNTLNGLSLLASYSEKNFLGRGQAVDFKISVSESARVFNFDFTEPYLLGRDLAFNFDTTYRLTDNEGASYDTETFRISPALTFAVSDAGRLRTYVAAEYGDITDLPTNIAPPIAADAAEGGLWTSSLGYSYSWDNRRFGLNPDTTWVFRAGQEFGFGDAQFVSSTALAAVERGVLNDAVTLRATLEGGYLHYYDGDSRIIDRYFLASRQMRGFELNGVGPRYYDDSDPANVIDDPLGGNAYAVARLEAEFPLGLPDEYGISGGVFVDYGSLWDPGLDCSGANYHYCEFTPRSVAGVSLFWATPIGPLRFNWTEPLSVEALDETRSFELTISTNF